MLQSTTTRRGNIIVWIALGGAALLAALGAFVATTRQAAEEPLPTEVATTTPGETRRATSTEEVPAAEDADEVEPLAPAPAPAPPPPPPPTAPLSPPPPPPPPAAEAAAEPEPPAPSATEEEPVVQSLTVEADDRGAEPDEIFVSEGATVELTFFVKEENVYFGGLLFESGEGETISTGDIDRGESKTVTFIAEHDRTFIPYWPSSRTRKPYEVRVTVQ